jgi:hypothetical protein
MSHFASENDRVMNLLADAASTGLDARSADELAMLLGDAGGAETESMELAAAALDLALQGEAGVEAMPARVMASVAAEAAKFVGASGASASASATSPERQRVGSSNSSPSLALTRAEGDAAIPSRPVFQPGSNASRPTSGSPGGGGGLAYLGWLVAAAGIALAASVWLPQLGSNAGGTSGGGGGAVASGTSKLTFDDLKARPGTIEIAWKPLPDETCQEKCSGEVIWNNELQQGYMTFKGLAANDPATFQYQLWVFDASQKHPVDGGVFDIAEGSAKVNSRGEVVVPVVAKIRVDTPQAFAVTIEKPGGVVVSDQKRIATLAPVSKG